MRKDIKLLERALAYHAGLAPFRRERERNKRYNYGRQWGDPVEVDGVLISEEEYIRRQGNIPLKNNLIRRLVRNVVGVYRNQAMKPRCVACCREDSKVAARVTRLLHENMELNRLDALYMRTMEEFLIGGFVVHRKSFGPLNGENVCRTHFVQPNNFFVDDRMHDFRGWDCTTVGEIHDIPLSEVVEQFADVPEADLRAIFPGEDDTPCRVVEVWRRRAGKWGFCFLAHDGTVLAEGRTPYAHGSHPFVFKAYPMIDGEIHSFVNDVIDQQRYTNRLITLYDWIMRASAKGVLLVPEDCIPRDVTPEDFAESWSRYNGVIVYRPSAMGNVPQQVSANSTDIGIRDLLNLQLRFFEDISGVNDTLQGKTGNFAMSAQLYDYRMQNATTTLLDLLDTFNEFVRDCAEKDVSNILQYTGGTAARLRITLTAKPPGYGGGLKR